MTQNIPPKTGPSGDQAVSITTPNLAAVGTYAGVTPFGRVMVAPDSQTLFADPFEGVTVDTTNRWTTAGTVPPTQVTGSMSVNPGATASATSAITSQPTFQFTETMHMGWQATIEATAIATGNHRFMGFGTSPTTPGTSVAPLQDAIGFEIDTSGVMRCSVYTQGTRTFTQVLTTPTDGLVHRYIVTVRGDVAMWFYDKTDIAVAFTYVQPNTQIMPARFASLNSASVTGTPTMTVVGISVLDAVRPSTQVSDGTYAWRKAKVGSYGDQSVSITSPAAAAAGISVGLNSFGALNVSMDANTIFNDSFDSGTIDATNRWLVSGTVAPVQGTGTMTLNPSTTASATVALTSLPTFTAASPLFLAWEATFEAAVTLGNHRFMGWGQPASQPGTSAAPLQDAIGFEIDTTGALRASVYASGTRTFSQVLTRPTDAARHTYVVVTRGDVCMWYVDTFDLPLASTKTQPMTSWLPVRFASLNSASVTVGTPTFLISGVSVLDQARSSLQISDGTYPWRKAQISKFGAQYTNPGPSLLPGYTGFSEATFTLVASTRKDALSIEHSAAATKTVKIRRITVAAYNTSAVTGYVYCRVFYGTAATSAGTVQTATKVNEASAAAEAVLKTNPTIVAATQKLTAGIGLLPATTGAGVGPVNVYDATSGSDLDAFTLRAGFLETITVAVYSTGANALQPLVNIYFTEE